MAKRKSFSREEQAFPIATIPSFSDARKPPENATVTKLIIRGAIQGAYHLSTPTEPGPYSPDYGKKQKPLVSEEQVQFVTHLIESLEPQNAIEAAIAAQFAITFIRGLEKSQDYYSIDDTLELFEFGHRALETLQRFRCKGAQTISVNYNHNQAQVNNFNINKNDARQAAMEIS